MGCSMGGMIVQRLAIDHTDRVLSMTSVMSRTGEPGTATARRRLSPSCWRPRPPSREEYIDRQVAAHHVYGSKPEWLDDDAIRARAAAAYDRCFYPAGTGRQMQAVADYGSRADQLAELDLPGAVIHGSRDTLIAPSGGRRTAAVIPACDVEIEGMGHDYPPPVWKEWVAVWSAFAHGPARAGAGALTEGVDSGRGGAPLAPRSGPRVLPQRGVGGDRRREEAAREVRPEEQCQGDPDRTVEGGLPRHDMYDVREGEEVQHPHADAHEQGSRQERPPCTVLSWHPPRREVPGCGGDHPRQQDGQHSEAERL